MVEKYFWLSGRLLAVLALLVETLAGASADRGKKAVSTDHTVSVLLYGRSGKLSNATLVTEAANIFGGYHQGLLGEVNWYACDATTADTEYAGKLFNNELTLLHWRIFYENAKPCLWAQAVKIDSRMSVRTVDIAKSVHIADLTEESAFQMLYQSRSVRLLWLRVTLTPDDYNVAHLFVDNISGAREASKICQSYFASLRGKVKLTCVIGADKTRPYDDTYPYRNVFVPLKELPQKEEAIHPLYYCSGDRLEDCICRAANYRACE